MEGFFDNFAFATTKPPRLLADCGSCGLYRQCRSPKIQVAGSGRKGILVVGEAPGKEEDARGQPFIGASGEMVESAFRELGINFRKDCWITNSVICRPYMTKDGYIHKPTPKQMEYCRPNLTRLIEETNPTVIVPLGGPAVSTLLSHVWKDKKVGSYQWAGWSIPCQKPNAWIAPNFHPAYILRRRDKYPWYQDYFVHYLKNAVEKAGTRPWEKTPDYRAKVKVVTGAMEAAAEIRKFGTSPAIAFDYETDRLKPDHPDARILSCAISDGKRTVAYPWYGEAVEATSELLLRSDIAKVGFNLKFELRWTMRILKHGVRNFRHCGQITAHILDARKGTKSIKFQAFVHFGAPAWDAEVEPYMRSDGGSNAPNRLKEYPRRKLLVYNGVDALMEYMLYVKQREDLGL